MDGRTAAPTLETLLAEREWVGTLARVLAGNGPDADDLEQEAWVAALRSPPREPGPVRGWFATVMRRRRLDAGRAAARRLAREWAAARPEALPSAAESVARAETLRRVVAAVLALEEPGRSTVILRYFDGLPPREIAARTGVPVETVHTRLRRALDVLRDRLGGERDRRALLWFGLPAAAAAAAVVAGALLLPPAGPPPAADLPVASVPPPAAPQEPPPPAPPPATAPAPVAPPGPGAPAGRLVLRARVEPAAPRYREPMRLVATFENGTGEPVALFHPDITVTAAFPRWTLRGADGREWTPDPEWIGQSMWRKGPRGEIVRLAPGAEHAVVTPIELVVPAEGGGPKTALRPGTYVVRCAYVRADTRVPWSEAFGKRDVAKEVEGLWTGTVEADPFEVRILPSDVPSIALSVPERLVPGSPCPVEVSLENTAATPMILKGRVLLRSVQKGTGVLDEADLTPEGGIRVEPESTLVLKADLARLPGDWLDRNSLMLLALLDFAAEGKEDLATDLVMRRVEPLPAAEGLRLAVEPQGRGRILLTLRNDGREKVRVPAGFAWPARLRLEFRDPEGKDLTVEKGGGTFTARVIWADAPGKARVLGADDFSDLEPGWITAGVVDLAGEGMPGLPAGTYDLVATWRNVESGLRGGTGVAPVVVGTVEAPAVRVEVPDR